MATSWPALTADEVLSGRGAEGALIGQGLFDRDLVARQGGTTVTVEASTASASYTTVDSFVLKVPEFVRSGHLIRLYVKLSQSTGTGYFRIQDNGSATDGTEVSTTSSSGEYKESTLTAPDATWAGTERTINVRAKTGGAGTVTLSTTDLAMNLRYSD